WHLLYHRHDRMVLARGGSTLVDCYVFTSGAHYSDHRPGRFRVRGQRAGATVWPLAFGPFAAGIGVYRRRDLVGGRAAAAGQGFATRTLPHVAPREPRTG